MGSRVRLENTGGRVILKVLLPDEVEALGGAAGAGGDGGGGSIPVAGGDGAVEGPCPFITFKVSEESPVC